MSWKSTLVCLLVGNLLKQTFDLKPLRFIQCLINIRSLSLFMDVQLLTNLLVEEHLDYFQFLAIMNRVFVNICFCVNINIVSVSRIDTRVGMLRQNVYAILHFHQQCTKFLPVTLHPCQHLVFSEFLILILILE